MARTHNCTAMKKLRAFTLMELLVGMIISSIVISFGYAAYTLIYKQFISYRHTKEKVMELAQFDQVLSNDLLRAEVVYFHENALQFFQKNAIRTLQYNFYDDLILRKENELTDTFKISQAQLKMHFLLPDKQLFLDQLSFDTDVFGEKEHFTFDKTYSSETLMNNESVLKNQ